MRFELSRIRPDKMTRQERWAALEQGKPVDRVPFSPWYAMAFFAKSVGASLRSHYENPERCFFDQLLCRQMYDHDGGPGYGWAERAAWEFGAKVRLPRSEYDMAPVTDRFAAESEEEAWNLKLPDVETMGFFPNLIRWNKLAEEHGEGLSCFQMTPFCTAVCMVGAKRFFPWMITNPALCHHLLRLATEHIVRVVQYIAGAFGNQRTRFSTSTGPEENTLTSPAQFEEFALPYIKECHERVLALGIVRSIEIHVCGDHNLNLPLWRQVPLGDVGWFGPAGSQMDITKVIEFLGDKNIIMGNISTWLLRDGTPHEVYEVCRKTIEKGKKAPRGFVLMPACEVPPQTPPINLWAMRKAVSDFGWYD